MSGNSAWQASLVTPEQNRRSISTPKPLETRNTRETYPMLYINNDTDISKDVHQNSSDERVIHCYEPTFLDLANTENDQKYSYYVKIKKQNQNKAVLSWYKRCETDGKRQEELLKSHGIADYHGDFAWMVYHHQFRSSIDKILEHDESVDKSLKRAVVVPNSSRQQLTFLSTDDIALCKVCDEVDNVFF